MVGEHGQNLRCSHGSFATGFFKTELVAGSVVLINPVGLDEHKPGDHVFADYNSFSHLLPGASAEPYFFAHTTLGVASKEKIVGEMDTLAAGGRIIGKVRGKVDYSFEPVHEFGSYSSDRLNANGLVAGGGWTITQSGWKPRLSSDYAYASGDNGRKDDSRETFDNMYGYNQPMNSVTGVFGWKNIKDLRTGVELAPLRRLKVKLDGRDLWLASTADGLYNSAGTRTVYDTKATNAHVGETIEMLSTVSVTKSTSVGFGVGTLFSGAYLQEAHKGATFIYPYITLFQGIRGTNDATTSHNGVFSSPTLGDCDDSEVDSHRMAHSQKAALPIVDHLRAFLCDDCRLGDRTAPRGDCHCATRHFASGPRPG
jgi:hypothetical protein